MLSASLPQKNRFQSPPERRIQSAPIGAPTLDIAQARKKEKSPFGFAKVALGLGLAAGTLAACGSPVPPASEAGAYELEDAEVVILNHSIDRIDLARETDTVCTGSFEDETCFEVDEPYHEIGIHMGHGIVQDLNGNLFAAPQLAAEDAPGHAVANPDSVYVDGPLFTEGRVQRTGDSTFDVSGSVFGGKYSIRLDGKNAVVTTPSLIGRDYESMRISHVDGVNTISQGRWEQQHVQSQGDHLLVQNTIGSELGRIEHDTTNGTYTISEDRLFGDDYMITATYGPQQYKRSGNSWGGTRVQVEENEAGQHETTFNRGRADYTVTPNGQGWTSKANGLLGSTTDYQITGGVNLPG